MASSSLSSRLFANVLKGIEHEKAEQLKKEWEARRASLDAEEAKQRGDAALLIKKREDFADRERHEREELTELEQKARDASVRGEEERRIDAAAARASVFRGSDATEVKERLMREGVPENLAQEIVKLRTLDQAFENTGGMRARFLEKDDPTKQGGQPLYQSIDESVGGARARKREGNEQQYLRTEEPENLYTLPDTVRDSAERPGGYQHKLETGEDNRKGIDLRDEGFGYKR